MTHFEYKEYLGTIEPQIESGTLFGKLAYIKDLVTYEANTVKELEKEFHNSVDEYLTSCEELNRKPNIPCKGSFSVRTGASLHRAAVIASGEQSLNSFVCDAIKEKVNRQTTIISNG
jgi:predicted HicB family RNase H-like nuclease